MSLFASQTPAIPVAHERVKEANNLTLIAMENATLKSKEASVTEQCDWQRILNDVTNPKGDLLKMFSSVSKLFGHNNASKHDECLKDGTVQGFARALHNYTVTCPLKDSSNDDGKEKKKSKNKNRPLQVASVCRAIDGILRCSDEALTTHGVEVARELIAPSLPFVVDMFTKCRSDVSIRLVTLTSAVRIMRRIEPLVDLQKTKFLETTCRLLRDDIPQEVRGDAAHALAQFILNRPAETNELLSRISKEARIHFISILSKFASGMSSANIAETMEAFQKLSTIPELSSVIAKRRCSVIALQKNFFHDNPKIRKRAVKTAKILMEHNFEDLEMYPTVFESNLDLMTNALVQAALKEKSSSLLSTLLDLLHDLLKDKKKIQPEVCKNILKVFYLVASPGTDKYDGKISTSAALYYLTDTSKATQDSDVLANTVSFIINQDEKVRAKALGLIKETTFWKPKSANILLTETSFLESASFIIRHGCDRDCQETWLICKQLIFDGINHGCFLAHKDFMSAFVHFLMKEPVTNRSAYAIAVEVLLDLLTDDQVKTFVGYPDLLPWLVTHANRTVSEELKSRFVAAIIRFSSVLLEE